MSDGEDIFNEGSDEEFNEADEIKDLEGFEEDEDEEEQEREMQVEEDEEDLSKMFDKEEELEKEKKVIKPVKKEIASKKVSNKIDADKLMAQFYNNVVTGLNNGKTNEEKAVFIAKGFQEAIRPIISAIEKTQEDGFLNTPQGKFYLESKKEIPSITPEVAIELYEKMAKQQQVNFIKGKRAAEQKKTGLSNEEKKIAKALGVTEKEYLEEKSKIYKGSKGWFVSDEIDIFGGKK